MIAGRSVNQLHRYAQLLATFAHAAFDDMADTQIARHLSEAGALAPLVKRRIAGGDRKLPEPRKLGDDVFGDPVGEILLPRIAAHIVKGKHGDGGF